MPVQHPVPAGTLVSYEDIANQPATEYRVIGSADTWGGYELITADGTGRFHSSDLRQYGWNVVPDPHNPAPNPAD